MQTALLITAGGTAVYALYRLYRQAKLDKNLVQRLPEGALRLNDAEPFTPRDL